MAAKKVVIGGGTGFVGQRLGELLKLHQYEILNVSRMPGVNNISWSNIKKTGLPLNTYAVVNCAGQQFMDFTKSWSPGFKQNVHNSRVYTTQALADAINKHYKDKKPVAYVVITGVGAYEPSDDKRYDEASPAATGTDFFSKLVVEWENAAKVDPPVRLVIIRSGAVLGRWGGMIKNMFMPFYLGMGGPIGSGKQFLPWIHIDDLVRLIHFAIENPEVKGILNGVAPQVITNEEFTKAFAKALNRPAFLPVPELFLNLLLNPERAMIMTKGQCVVPKKVEDYGFKYKYPHIEDACKEFSHLFPKKT
ncbi:epimerase family protein SDR39U1 [Pectinophora gossypiella]|uniref:epimerase family protein SDR39U1 n=1 Tax=Pectinophora gossypiella TaxID=13191 RepID=UPI00214EFE70|nr:epimerase family protein SDR39U1 [Pectinophora gossypiella]